MCSLIEKHQGRVVDSPGGSLLAEFASVVDALECAVEIQKELKGRNEELPKERRIPVMSRRCFSDPIPFSSTPQEVSSSPW